MIIALVFLGSFFGLTAAVAMYIQGVSIWVALAGYVLTGSLSVVILAAVVFAARVAREGQDSRGGIVTVRADGRG